MDKTKKNVGRKAIVMQGILAVPCVVIEYVDKNAVKVNVPKDRSDWATGVDTIQVHKAMVRF